MKPSVLAPEEVKSTTPLEVVLKRYIEESLTRVADQGYPPLLIWLPGAEPESGKDSPVKGVEYAANTEYPEVLAANPTPVRLYDGRDGLKMNPEFASYFPGMEEKDIMKEVEKTFAEGIEHSKTKEINPQVYEMLKKYVDGAFEQKYGIKKAEEVEKGPTL